MSGVQFIRPQSTGLSGLGEMLESYCKLQPKLKTVNKFTDALQLIWSALQESHWQRCERQPQLTAGMCVTQWWKFWTCNMTVGNRLLYSIKCHLMWLVFLLKIYECRNKVNVILKIWGVTQVKIIHFTQCSDKLIKIGVDIGIWLRNNQDNFQLRRFTRRENTAKSFRGVTFLTHTVSRNDLYYL